MTRIHYTGVRKINFKDMFNEVVGGSVPALWEGVGTWSVGYGAGVNPWIWKGWGHRALVDGIGSIFAKTPAPWGTLAQDVSGRRDRFQYDFMFRCNSEFEGQGFAFDIFVTHGGTPTFTVSKGYRVRFDGTNVILEKIDTGGGIAAWTAFTNPDSDPSTIACALSNLTDYYCRLTYIPADISAYTGFNLGGAGMFVLEVTDDRDMIGQGTVLHWEFQDASPLTGSSSSTIGIEVLANLNMEWDGIVYANDFLDMPQYSAFYASIPESTQSLVVKFNAAESEPWDWLAVGDRVEWWLRERRVTCSGINPNGDKYINIRKFDGRVKQVIDRDVEGMATVILKDEFWGSVLSKKEEMDPSTTDTDYYGFLTRVVIGEYQGQVGFPARVTRYPSVSSTAWGTVISSNWKIKGTYKLNLDKLCKINNAWFFWSPTGQLISRAQGIATSKTLDLTALGAEYQWIERTSLVDDRDEGYANKVSVHHDNGAGSVTTTTVQNAANVTNEGEVHKEIIDPNIPNAEGITMATNILNQMGDTTPVVDVITRFYGFDFHIACIVGIKDPSKDIDETDYFMIEEEIIHDPHVKDGAQAGFHRMRFAYQGEIEQSYYLPRAVIRRMGYEYERRERTHGVSRLWT